MRMCPIASGSSGNSIYIGSERTHLLVDAGISKKKIEEGLKTTGLKGGDIDAILITHEHADHIQGLGVFVRKYPVPIYGTAATLKQIQLNPTLGYIPPELFVEITPDRDFTLGDISVSSMRVSHDAADPVAYSFDGGGKRIAIATDMGIYDDYVVEHLKGMDVLLLEANHDIRMLQVGPYPYQLKQRILSERGHLSNETAGRLLSDIACDRLSTIVLGHLSKENNLPELAYETVRLEIEAGDNEYHANDFEMIVAKRSEPTCIIEL